jgi:hypothetical protein
MTAMNNIETAVAQSQLPPFDLIIEPFPDGMVLIGVKVTARGFDELMASLSDHRDGFAVGCLCGGCAKEFLSSTILERPAPDLFVARGDAKGRLLALDTREERQALLDQLGSHIH